MDNLYTKESKAEGKTKEVQQRLPPLIKME